MVFEMKKLLITIAILTIGTAAHASPAFIVGKPLPLWQKGELDIYHLSIGMGNSTLMVFPDGTTLLYDMGDATPPPSSTTPFPQYAILANSKETPYDYVAKFIHEFSPHPNDLNYVVLSHYHFDHIGEWDGARPISKEGGYALFGVTGLAQEIHIHTLIDRSYPDYQYHGDFPKKIQTYLHSNNEYGKKLAHTLLDYQKFIQYQTKKNGLIAEKFDVGSNNQIHPVYASIPNFEVQNIIGDGVVWNGKDLNTYPFIRYAENDQGNVKKENDLSVGFRIDDGPFRYFTGGDMTGRLLTGKDIDSSAEGVAAPVIGNVDVATMNHHGFDDAQSEIWVKTLRPQVWIQQNWAASQTGLSMLLRVLDPHSYNYLRDLFSTNHFALNDLSLPALGNSKQSSIDHYYKAAGGNIVVRVLPGGKEFWVIVLSRNLEHPVVQAVYGPYFSSRK